MNAVKFRSIITAWAIIVCFLLGGVPFAADSLYVTDESDSIYGRGIHAFFDRHYEEAVAILSRAEELGYNDPRPYYFLGLSYLRQMQADRADQYFKKAAQLEFSGRTLRDYAVSESLRRIQGEERQHLEKIRVDERANAQIREQVFRDTRYGRDNAAARDELRQSAQQSRREYLAAPQAEELFGENAFGVKPIDPTRTPVDRIFVRRGDSSLFGTIVVDTGELPAASRPAVSRDREHTPAQPIRTFVNADAPAAVPATGSSPQSAANTSLVRSAQAEMARQIGRTLGTLFSRKKNAE